MKPPTLLNVPLAGDRDAVPQQSLEAFRGHRIHPDRSIAESAQFRKVSDAIPEEVASEMKKLKIRLKAAGHPLAELPDTLAPLLGAKGSKGWKEGLEEAILSLKPGDEIKVAAVLAHTTAFKEVDATLNTAAALSQYFSLDFTLILTHWEDLAHPVVDEVFETITMGIQFQLRSRFRSSRFVAVDRSAISSSPPFVQAREEIWDRVKGTPCVDDLNWIVEFYGRQNSYRPQGMAQALHDFTMRRGIGLLIEQFDPKLVLLTEMKERLSRCYRCPCPVLNVIP